VNLPSDHGPILNPPESVSLGGAHRDAVAYVEKYAATHKYWGYKKRQDSWWCRNEGDEILKTLVVRPS
jgi:hypothetical protein